MDNPFFYITKMSEAFREECERKKEMVPPPEWFQLWQIRAQLAIAQQLSVIAAALKKDDDNA